MPPHPLRTMLDAWGTLVQCSNVRAAERRLKGSVWSSTGFGRTKRSWLSSDIVAGITLAALAIPEVMGYTKIAGMP